MDIETNTLNQVQNFNQTHLISFWDQLDSEQRAILLRDLSHTDFEHITNAFEGVKDQLSGKIEEQPIDQWMEPIPEHLTGSVEKTSKEQLENYRREGLFFF